MSIINGISDQQFIRGDVPMTKAEVRVISLSKLDLHEDSLLYDVGAGTGSVSVQAARLLARGSVIAMERNKTALELLEQNKARFGVDNLRIVAGEAPHCMAELPPPDRVFIGGSGGNLEDIVELVDNRLPLGGRIVINAVTIGTVDRAVNLLAGKNYLTDAVTVNVSRLKKVGGSYLWQAQNPVTIIWGIKEE